MITRSQLFALGKILLASTAAIMLFNDGIVAQERRDESYYLGEINKASSVMVVEQGIVPKELGKTIANAVSKLETSGTKVDDEFHILNHWR